MRRNPKKRIAEESDSHSNKRIQTFVPDNVWHAVSILDLNLLDCCSLVALAETCKSCFRIVSPFISRTCRFFYAPFQFVIYKPEKISVAIQGAVSLPPSTKILHCHSDNFLYPNATLAHYLHKIIQPIPHLTTLKMPTISLICIPKCLPPTLTSLTIRLGESFTYCPGDLPVSLKELDIDFSLWRDNYKQFSNTHSARSLLANIPLLETLTIHGWNLAQPQAVGPLPSSVRHLSLIGIFALQSLSETLIGMPNLSTLSIDASSNSQQGNLNAFGLLWYIPSSLTHLTIPNNILSNPPPVFPTSLVSFTLGNPQQSLILEQHPALWMVQGMAQCLNLHHVKITISGNLHWSQFPIFLTELHIDAKQVDIEAKFLPQTLKKLSIRGIFDLPLLDLPSGLISLELNVGVYSHTLDILPPNLLHLTLCVHTLTQPLIILPSNLHSFSLSFISYPPNYQIDCLPHRLYQLIVRTKSKQLQIAIEPREQPLIANFPPSIQILKLVMPISYLPSVQQLPPTLRVLSLSPVTMSDLGTTKMVYSELAMLSNLRSLKLRCKESELIANPPFNFPPTITYLDLGIFRLNRYLSSVLPFPIIAWPPFLKSLRLTIPHPIQGGLNYDLPLVPASLRHLSYNLQYLLDKKFVASLITVQHTKYTGWITKNNGMFTCEFPTRSQFPLR